MKKNFTVYYDVIYEDGSISDNVYESMIEAEDVEEALEKFRSYKSKADARVLQVSIIAKDEIDKLYHTSGDEWCKAYDESVKRRNRVAAICGNYEN